MESLDKRHETNAGALEDNGCVQGKSLIGEVDECIGDLSPTEAGICVGEQLMGVKCPRCPFIVQVVT
jgi:hypothetical protein